MICYCAISSDTLREDMLRYNIQFIIIIGTGIISYDMTSFDLYNVV